MIENLMDFGLSRLEASVYLALCSEPGVTGYRLSHILDKPTANIYKALKSLEGKGLVQRDKSSSVQSIHPVPIEEFLRTQEMLFQAKSRDLKEGLKNLERKQTDFQISRLGSFEQVLSRSHHIIEEATEVVVIVAFVEVLEKLQDLLLKRSSEGIEVILYTYSPYELQGCKVFQYENDSRLWQNIPERAFDVAVDGRIFIISNFKNDYRDVIEALYGNHIYLSLMIFNSLSKNILVQEMVDGQFFSDSTKEELKSFFQNHQSLLLENLPGVKKFFKKHKIPDFEARV